MRSETFKVCHSEKESGQLLFSCDQQLCQLVIGMGQNIDWGKNFFKNVV